MDRLIPILALGGLLLFIFVLSLELLAAYRRKPNLWDSGLNALSGPRKAREKQDADLDELHRRVADILKK